MVIPQQGDQAPGRGQADGAQQRRERPVVHQHRCPLEGQGERHKPGHQRCSPAGAKAHHRRVLAVGGVFLHLVEVGAEQHQRGGHRRAAAQHQGLAPGHPSRLNGRTEGQQTGRRGQRPEGQPAQGLAQAAVPQPERRPLIHVAQAAASQHQRQHRGATAPGHQGHQQQPPQQTAVGQGGHPVAPAGEVHHRVGLAVGIHAGVRIEHVVGQVFPGQQQHRRQQEGEQLIQPHHLAAAKAEACRQQHRHHRHRIHRPLDRGLPEAAAIGQRPGLGVTACDDLRLCHGRRRRQPLQGPYI